MKFTKMHSLGNDYIVVNCFEEDLDFEPSRLAELMCDRHFGVGADALMIISPSELADFKMSLWNADGSKTELCGNGVMCFAKYVYDHRLTNMTSITVESLDGIKKVDMSAKEEKMRLASVNVGIPTLRSNGVEIPIDANTINYRREDKVEVLKIGSQDIRIVFLNIGVPHAIIFANNLDAVPIATLGPAIESHSRFPEKTNVDFVQVVDKENLKVKSWSRGVGETMSNGTGAAASAVASWLLGFSEREVSVKLAGGTLQAEISDEGKVSISGPATEVFTGEIEM